MTRSTPAIVRATLQHIRPLAGLLDRYRVFYGTAPDPAGAERFCRDRIERDESIILLALADDEPAGFVQLYPTFSSVSLQRRWIVNDLFVEPAFRRRGIARALMLEAVRAAQSESRGVEYGVKDFELKTEITNDPAQQLYESLGWVRDERFYTYRLKP